MNLLTRIANVFRLSRVDRDLDEEIEAHIADAVAEGREEGEARRAFGPRLRIREESRDSLVIHWLDTLRADAIFGWRQLVKHRISSAAAILSLALAIGACASAFRIIDALLLRPLPVAAPDRLFTLSYDVNSAEGQTQRASSFDYPQYQLLRDAVKDQAQLLAISRVGRFDLTYSGDQEYEKAYRQWVSGPALSALGLKPALGRIFSVGDERTPGAHPYVVLSHDYWHRRFAGQPSVLGLRLRSGNNICEIVGVLEAGFTGTEPGRVTDIFMPTMMNVPSVTESNWAWFRTWVQLSPHANPESVRQRLQAVFTASRQERLKQWADQMSPREKDLYASSNLYLEASGSGASEMQTTYRRPLQILAGLVLLILWIACANVANLMTAQASSREREMALRVAIGAGRARLLQLVAVESAIIAIAASAIGAAFASWAAPFVIGMIGSADDTVRLMMPLDWRVFGFGLALAVAVTFLFGLAPAIRASRAQPSTALKGKADSRSQRRLMAGLVAVQVSFCFVVQIAAGMFVATLDRLNSRPLGFDTENVLLAEAVTPDRQPTAKWLAIADRLTEISGVRAAGLANLPLLGGYLMQTNVWMNGKSSANQPATYVLPVSDGWRETMRIPLLAGRDLRSSDLMMKQALVNQAFARQFFAGQNPVGKFFGRKSRVEGKTVDIQTEIVGLVGDAHYESLRERIHPTIYQPARTGEKDDTMDWATFHLSVNQGPPEELAGRVRRAIADAGGGIRVSSVRTQAELVRGETTRERLLAILSSFFAVVALLLAAVGLFGVLDYAVLQRRREIGIRIAVGATPTAIVSTVTSQVSWMLALGAVTGAVLGGFAGKYLDTLAFEVKATDAAVLSIPVLTILAAAILAALPPLIRAVRVDPATTLRAD